MTGKRRSTAQIHRDRRREAELYLQGKLQAEIADELGLNQATVSRDLKALHKQWLESSLIDFDAAKAKELARIDHLERQYWKAWVVSTERFNSSITKGKGRRGQQQPQFVEKMTRSEDRRGDPRYLGGVQWCINRRCKLLGLDAPTKFAPTDPTGQKEYGGDYRERLERQLAGIATRLGAFALDTEPDAGGRGPSPV